MTEKKETHAQLADDLLEMAKQLERELAKAKAKRQALLNAKAELEKVDREYAP